MDLISRQAAIDAILSVTGNSSVRELYEHVQEHGLSDMWSGGINAAIDIIIALPSTQPEPHWIPCSERLPEDGTYIVYAPYYTGGSSSAKECHNGIMFSKIKNGKWSIEHGYHKRPNCVWAWMPMPEPYREEGE